jgi:acetylornithine deacetylase
MKAVQKEDHQAAVELLKQLIATPSFSRDEGKTADIIEEFFRRRGIQAHRIGNNVWAKNKNYNERLPTLMLNSHHDTVRPNPSYTINPFEPIVRDGKLYGLGSNDAGGPLVSLIATFLHFYESASLPYNLLIAASAEEEISGTQGIEMLMPGLPPIDCAIVGEPTLTDVAVAEKGLMVLDCVATGKAGHAAREEGVNAIYASLKDIEWFKTYSFPRKSSTLGKVKMSVTIIHAGQAHNQVPPECLFTVDVRVTDAYTLEEVFTVVKKHVSCAVKPRSMRLRPSGIALTHPLVLSAKKLGKKLYGSPTTSDQALIQLPSIKMGPGDSARSHSADEFIYLREIEEGIEAYVRLVEGLTV